MQIETEHGTKSVASMGLAGTALGLGAAAFLGIDLENGFFGGRGRGRGGRGHGELCEAQVLLAENAMLKADIYTDNKVACLEKQICQLEKQVALDKQAIHYVAQAAKEKDEDIIKFVECNFIRNKKYLPSDVIVGDLTACGYTFNPPATPTAG